MSQLYRTMTGQSTTSIDTSKPTPLSRMTTSDPKTGVLNHLTDHQRELLSDFKQKLEAEGWWSPIGLNGHPTHDDGTLLRYLRARKFDVQGAIGQFTDTEKWLKEQKVEELYENFDVEFYEKARAMYPQWTGRRDKRGIPVYVYVIKHLDSKNVSKYQKQSQEYKNSLPSHKKLATSAKLIPLFALYHNLLSFVMPFCSTLERPSPEIPITTTCNIVDISGVGLAQFWNLKQHMQDASVLATAHYPETLDRIFIIGAPAFFPTVWGWIKRWFDPVTVSKIFILAKHEVKPTLLRFMPVETFPKRYGGELDWDFGDVPKPEPEILAKLEGEGRKGWSPGPAYWLDHRMVLVGKDHGKLRQEGTDVQALKPFVYAADQTDEPVHPNAAQTNGLLSPHSAQVTNGSVNKYSEAGKDVNHTGAVTTAAVAATAAGTAAVVSADTPSTKDHPTSPTKDIPSEELRKSPVDGSAVRMPQTLPNPPTATAEYVSSGSHSAEAPPSSPTKKHHHFPHLHHHDHHSSPLATSTTATQEETSVPTQHSTTAETTSHTASVPASASTISQENVPPIAAIPQPGPPSNHESQMTSAITSKLAGESVSIIPASSSASSIAGANGHLVHPELLVATDPSKGLALETSKLNLATGGRLSEEHAMADGGVGGGQRPVLERFVTALEN